jgi:hypothetical protein
VYTAGMPCPAHFTTAVHCLAAMASSERRWCTQQECLVQHTSSGQSSQHPPKYTVDCLKVLSSEMAHSIDLFQRKRHRGFLEKSARSPSSESPLKYERASYFSTANYAINLDSCGEYSLRIWIKCFSFIPQFTIINEHI